MEAVAKQFSGTWEKGDDSCDAWLTIAEKRIAVEITAIKRRRFAQPDNAKPHLRFDKVVIRLLERQENAAREIVPDGSTVLVTVTAPIRLPSKTAEALEDKIRALVGRGSPGRDQTDTIQGNRVRIRLLEDKSERAPKLIGFVHNSDSDPRLLLDMTGELLEGIEDKPGSRTPTGDQWLVISSPRKILCLEAYRYIYSRLRPTDAFTRILMVFGDGHVGTLTD